MDDVPRIAGLVADSVWVLQAKEYTDAQREAAIRLVYGIDTQLVRDGTYFVVEQDGMIVGCGGWSRRQTLFGGDQHATQPRAQNLLDPANDAARIRAFFVRPGWERRGIGSALVRACEQAAVAEGFRRMEMASTLTGIALYSAHGYREVERIDVPLEDGLTLPVVRMSEDSSSFSVGVADRPCAESG